MWAGAMGPLGARSAASAGQFRGFSGLSQALLPQRRAAVWTMALGWMGPVVQTPIHQLPCRVDWVTSG